MEKGAEDNVGQKPGYIFELSADLGCGRTYSIRGNFAVNTPLETMNVEMDKLVRVCDRQLSKAVIGSMEEDIYKHEHQLGKFKADLLGMLARAKGHKSLPQIELANQENQKTNIMEMEDTIERKKRLLAKTKKDAE